MMFWRSQFDKCLMTFLILVFCGLALWGFSNEKTHAFALQSAAGCLGCLITLVTARRNSPEATLEPTSVSSTTTTTSKSETVASPVVDVPKLP